MKRFFVSLLFAALLPSLPVLAADEAPDELVKTVTNDVLTIVRQDKDIQSGNTRKAVDLVEEKVLPHFNFRRMTILAVGRDWRSATPEEQGQLVESFKTLLVRTYSNALTQYKNQQIDFKPLRASASDTDVIVRTEVRQPGATAVQIDYSLEKGSNGWKVYDVVVAGVSLVTNYRGTFSQEIRSGGIAGLIKALEEKNRQLAEAGAKA